MSERELNCVSLAFGVLLTPLQKKSGKLLRNRLRKSDQPNFVAGSYLGLAEFLGGVESYFLKSAQEFHERFAAYDVDLHWLERFSGGFVFVFCYDRTETQHFDGVGNIKNEFFPFRGGNAELHASLAENHDLLCSLALAKEYLPLGESRRPFQPLKFMESVRL